MGFGRWVLPVFGNIVGGAAVQYLTKEIAGVCVEVLTLFLSKYLPI